MVLFAVFAVQAIRGAIVPVSVSRLWLIVAGLILVIAIGFRREVGGDWWNYLAIYSDIARSTFTTGLQRTEPAYAFINWIAVYLEVGIWFPNLVCGTIFIVGLIKFCDEEPNPSLGLLVALVYFVIVVGMGYTRQSAALGLVMLAIVQYQRGSILRMVLWLGLAATFHMSAVIMLAVLALASVHRGFFPTILFALLGALIAYQFAGTLAERLNLYTAESFSAAGAVPRLLMNLLPALVFLAFSKRLARNPNDQRLWTILAVISVLLALLLVISPSSALVDRIGLYLIPLQIVVWSRLPTMLGTPSKPSLLAVSAVIAYSLAVEVVWLNAGPWARAWIPYRNYLWDSGTGKIPPRWYRRIS